MLYLELIFSKFSSQINSIATNAKSILIPGEEKKKVISDFIFIAPKIFWMTYPSKEKIKCLSDTLNLQFTNNKYYIWNISEERYDTSFFNNQVYNNIQTLKQLKVAEFSFAGYPCPPLQYILVICKSILEWLSNDRDNVAIIHCQNTMGRSAVIISCLLSLLKIVNHPMEALTYFCNVKLLNIKKITFLEIKHK